MATVRELLGLGIERFERAGLSYGHGTTNALDEAAADPARRGAAAHGPEPEPRSHAHAGAVKAARALRARRVRTRKPAAYLTHEAWLGPYRFYVDER